MTQTVFEIPDVFGVVSFPEHPRLITHINIHQYSLHGFIRLILTLLLLWNSETLTVWVVFGLCEFSFGRSHSQFNAKAAPVKASRHDHQCQTSFKQWETMFPYWLIINKQHLYLRNAVICCLRWASETWPWKICVNIQRWCQAHSCFCTLNLKLQPGDG